MKMIFNRSLGYNFFESRRWVHAPGSYYFKNFDQPVPLPLPYEIHLFIDPRLLLDGPLTLEVPSLKELEAQRMKRMIEVVFDNLGSSFDRYTVAFRLAEPDDSGKYRCLSLPSSPELEDRGHQWREYKLGNHLGVEIAYEDLPENVREYLTRWAKDIFGKDFP